MKTIQSPLIGRCAITAHDKHVRLFQVKQVLNHHRDQLITSLLKDIPYFIGQKYKAFATPEEIDQIKNKLVNLKQRDINLADYATIVQEIQRRSTITLNNEAFFREIDKLLLGKTTN